ncbi:hypothetical protein K2F40_05970 [Clostridium sp. CM028]|uniref:hypothetical protein n=1 Tax=Clostridium sp. CM028 TaxID=2851575 RepID=UPI001C6EDF7D|nr:hypothetical protein [Clostridium sp. CM028]MBW9148520.1 hypothetical protein [Clostridium sp. CM028]WLC61090.1 hypothetical protein KTC94_13370 [Clostridium sp. CM028]
MTEQVRCPICRRRLFDIEGDATGVIDIKCIQCKQVAQMRLDKPSYNNLKKLDSCVSS